MVVAIVQKLNRSMTTDFALSSVLQNTGGRCYICAEQTLRVPSPGGSTFPAEMLLPPS